MHYNPSFLTGAKLAIVKTAILLIIEGMMENKDPQRAAVLIGENRSKKIKEEQEALNKKNRLQDMPASSQSAATFVKKKGKAKA